MIKIKGSAVDAGRIVLLLLGCVVEDPHPQPPNTEEDVCFTCLFSGWFLMSTVLAGAYIGIAVNLFNAPPTLILYNIFESLDCVYDSKADLGNHSEWVKRDEDQMAMEKEVDSFNAMVMVIDGPMGKECWLL
jgi:hypothetical protein